MTPRERVRSTATVAVAPAPQSALSKAPGPLGYDSAHAAPLAVRRGLAPMIVGCDA